MSIAILAIESSCDDTAAAVIIDAEIKSNVVSSQKIHKKYGGVVPELASRSHQINILPAVEVALKEANVNKKDLKAIAFTSGPGLLGSLIVGVSFAKALSLSLNIPMIEVNHMQAHIHAHFIEDPKPAFPFLCLTVSGGHTQIVRLDDFDQMTILGQTIDDAAGEAFDKTGKMLQLDYPAGPIIDRLAKEGTPRFSFPTPNVEGLNFSFSGLKTAIRYFLRDGQAEDPEFISSNLNDICASVQDKIVSILLDKLMEASAQTGIKEIAIAGGVSANSYLREKLYEMAEANGWNAYIPKFEYCTDNAAMIAMSAHFKYLKKDFCDQKIVPQPRKKF